MNLSGATAKISAVAILFIAAFFVSIPYIGFAQEEDERNIIGSRVWCDDDLNGVLNDGERIPDVTIEVSGEGGFVETQVTDANGNYRFTGLPADTYTVKVITSTLPADCRELISEGPDSIFDGIVDGGNTIREEIGPLDNMTTVFLDTITHWSNTKQRFGYRPAEGIRPGTGSIGNYLWCDADLSGDSSNAFTSTNGVDLTTSISEILADVTVQLTNAEDFTRTTTTDENGRYLFTDIGVGPYTVNIITDTLPIACNIPALDPDDGAAHEADVKIEWGATGQGDDKLGIDFGYKPAEALGAAIGTIWCDTNGDLLRNGGEGMPAGTVVLMENTATNATYSDVAPAGGRFVITNLPAGEYSLSVDTDSLPETCVDPATGSRDSVGSPVTIMIESGFAQEKTPGGDDIEIGFSGTLPVVEPTPEPTAEPTAEPTEVPTEVPTEEPTEVPTEEPTPEPTAVVTEEPTEVPTEEPTPEPTAVVTEEPTVEPTDEVTPEPTDEVTPEPTSIPTASVVPANVAGTIWDDANSNGQQDEGEAGLVGIIVQLYNSDGTIIASQETSETGAYLMRGINPGDYYIKVVVPTGATGTSEGGDVDVATGETEIFTLSGNENKTIGAFGINNEPEGSGDTDCPENGCLQYLPLLSS